MDRNHPALANALRERRAELGLSQRAASDRSRRIDRLVNGSPQRTEGLGQTTWVHMEKGQPQAHQRHTLHLLDQTMRWPWGTAAALLDGEPLPEGDDASGQPCPCAPDRPTLVAAALDGVEDDEHDGAEVAMLRREVVHLGSRIEEISKTLDRLLKLVDL